MPPRAARWLLIVVALTCAPTAVLCDPPVLLGKTKPKEILAIAPAWQEQFDGYTPAADDLPALAGVPSGARLDVYFGSWCGDSRAGVPHLLKILGAAHSPLKVTYYGVDRSKKEPAKLLRDVGLERVPTFVLSVKGKEVGRIVETPATTLEHDLALLVKKAAGSTAS